LFLHTLPSFNLQYLMEEQGDLYSFDSVNYPEAEKPVLSSQENPSTTDTASQSIEETSKKDFIELEEIPEEHIGVDVENPRLGRPRGSWSRICDDYNVSRNPSKGIRKENVRKQFIRGFRTAIPQAFGLESVKEGELHGFDARDQYRKGKWLEFQLVVQSYPDLKVLIRNPKEKETKGFNSFNSDFCRALFAVPGAVEGFKVYVELVFGGDHEGLEQRLQIGVRATSMYERGGYWERLQDYVASEMLAEL